MKKILFIDDGIRELTFQEICKGLDAELYVRSSEDISPDDLELADILVMDADLDILNTIVIEKLPPKVIVICSDDDVKNNEFQKKFLFQNYTDSRIIFHKFEPGQNSSFGNVIRTL